MSEGKGTLNNPNMKSGQQAYDDWDAHGPGPLEGGEGEGALLDQTELFYKNGSAKPMRDGYPDLGPTENSSSSKKTEEAYSPEEIMRELNKR